MIVWWEVELRILAAEGVLTAAEADALGREAREKQQSPLALLVERGHLTEDSYRSLFAEAMNDAAWFASTHDGSERTYSIAPLPRTSEEPVFPVAAWDRYSNVRFLGQGGMGKVFLAVDSRLHREVAIKFVRSDDAEHVRRLITEARTQARVRHERVCEVYEVGEVEGKVYIAMQYIQGKPLGALTRELTLEQKVMVVRGAAEGIHEAHRAGIIHRDIKPSNIMIERGDDGELRPYVMDFGLARLAQEAGTTVTGAVLGTPHYMAPEQAQGAATQLDRRADVYSLGATLYHLIAGKPPVPGKTTAEVIHNLITQEPRPLRAIDPNIPIDLEAIIMKCLERERLARYDSARALAEDLARFLNGEPVQARPAGPWYRMRKRLAKHRRLVAAGVVAIVALGAAVGWGIKTTGAAAERGTLARRFTVMAERIEAMARYSALAPLHDTRGDRAEIRAKMDQLEDEIRRAGAVAEAPGHYALGCGYLALGDDAQARDELEAAWQQGFRERRVAFALAQVMGHLYQQNLAAMEPTAERDGAADRAAAMAQITERDGKVERAKQSEELHEARKREIERHYRDPALDYLAASLGADVAPPQYVAALMAYYRDQLDEALQQLDDMGSGRPWDYETLELRGDILLARARTLSDRGDRAHALADYEMSRNAYTAAAAIGRSVPAVYKSLADLEYTAMLVELHDQGDITPAYRRGMAAAANALATVADHYDALVLEARLQCRLAEHEAREGRDVEELLMKARVDAERATTISPERPQARRELAQIYRLWGDVLQLRHQDPSEQLARAVAISETVLARDRDDSYYADLGLVFSLWADYQDQAGVDSRAKREDAMVAYRRALEINSELSSVWINLGINWFKRASLPHATNPDADLLQAIAALDRASVLNPKHVVPSFYLGRIHALLAQRERARGKDPSLELERALSAYQKGLAVSVGLPYLHNGRGAVRLDQAKVAWDHGADPTPFLDEALSDFEHAVSVAPQQAFGYGNVGEVHARRAWFQRARGEDPSASVKAAVDALNQAIHRLDLPAFAADLGMAHAIQAAYDLEHDRAPRPSCLHAATAIQRALARTPNDAQSLFYLAETQGILARCRAKQGRGRAADFTAAAEAYHKASDMEPDNQEVQIAMGHFLRAWAAFQRDSGDDRNALATRQRGLALVNQVLAVRPAWPDALVLRASLTLLQARGLAAGTERSQQAASAAQDLAQALAINPALSGVWQRQAAVARQIAL